MSSLSKKVDETLIVVEAVGHCYPSSHGCCALHTLVSVQGPPLLAVEEES